MNRLIIILLTCFATAFISAQDIQFVAKAPGTVVVGNPFYLQYELNAEGDNLRAPVFEGFDHKAGPSPSSSTSYSYVNGRSSRSVSYTYTYVLAGEKEGVFTIAPATIEVKGKKYTSNSLTIKVIKGNQPNTSGSDENSSSAGVSNSDIFIRAFVNKSKPYQQEALVYTIKLYTRLSVSRIIDADYPNFNGFLSSDIEQKDGISEEVEEYNGMTYRTYVIHQKLLFPQSSGKINIDPATVNVSIRVRSQRRSRSIFDDVFSNMTQEVSKQLRANAVSFDVSALPSPKPSGFKNLVGSYSLKSSITETDIKVNDPVTLKLVLSGEGNLKMLATPTPDFPEDFEKFDPKVNNSLKTTLGGVIGSRTFEYLVIPRYAGEFQIPAVIIPYFDPKTKSYKTLSSQPFTINVSKGEGDDNRTVVSNFTSKEDVKFIGQDIRYINTDALKLKKSNAFLFGSTQFWLLLLIPSVLFLLALVLYRKQIKERANVALVKNKRANKVAKKRLKLASDFLKKGNNEAFYDEVLKALWGYTSDKLNIPVSRLNKDNVEDILKEKNISDAEVAHFIELLNTCEYARYAPSAVAGGMEETYKNAVSVISEMDNKIRK